MFTKVGQKIATSYVTRTIVRNARNATAGAVRKSKLARSIFGDLYIGKTNFTKAKQTAKASGKGKLASNAKGLGAFAKKVGLFPFLTGIFGFCCVPLPFASEMFTLLGLCAKHSYKIGVKPLVKKAGKFLTIVK